MMKLCTNIRRIEKAARSLKIDINDLKIQAKEEDYTTADAKSILSFLQIFHLYKKILIFLAALDNKL